MISCVNLSMLVMVTGIREGFATYCTQIGLFSCVSSGDFSGYQPHRKPDDTGDRNKAFLLSGLSCFMILDLAFVCLP